MNLFEGREKSFFLVGGIIAFIIVLFFGSNLFNAIKQYSGSLSKDVVPVTLTKEERDQLLKEIKDESAAIKKNKSNKDFNAVSSYLKLAASYERMGYRAKAEQAYEEVLARDEKNVSALVSLAMLQEKMEQYTKAESSYGKLINVQANARNYNLFAGFILERNNDPQRARALFLEGLQKTNNDTLLMKYFANFLEKIGDRYEAYLYWDAVSKKEPSNAEVRKNVERLKVLEADVIRATEPNK